MKIVLLTIIGWSSALRFNEVQPGVGLDVQEGRRRRRKGVGFYDSSNVEYIVKFPGVRTTTALAVAAYKVKLAEDIGALVFDELKSTAGVTETALSVNTHMKNFLKVTDWTLSTALLETKTPHFTDIITWPENPGWKTITPVSPNVFDNLFKRVEFTTLLQTKLRAESVDAIYLAYGVTGATAECVERTVSTSSLTGTFKVRVTVSDPAGGVLKPLFPSFASEVAATKVEDEGNPQAFLTEAKKALAGAFGVNTDYLSVERSDYMEEMCSTQIMFNFPTTSDVLTLQTAANALAEAAIVDRKFHEVFTKAAATVLEVDAEKITMNTFTHHTTLGTGAGVNGQTARNIAMQLRYATPCTGVTGGNIPFWYDEEASRVYTEIGADDTAHKLIAQQIFDEARKSSPFLVTFKDKAADDAYIKICNENAKGSTAANKRYISLPATTLANDNLLALVNEAAGSAGVADKVYQDGKGLKATAPDEHDMNAKWNVLPNTVGTAPQSDNAEYRIKYVISIKNAIDSGAAALVKSYVAMADASADDTDAFSVKVKDSMAASKSLLGLGCTVTNVWMRSEATSTTF